MRLTNQNNFYRKRAVKPLWLALLVVFVFVSCQITQNADDGELGLQWISSLPKQISAATLGNDKYVRLLHKKTPNQKSALVAEFDVTSCDGDKFNGDQSWRIFVHSVFGSQEIEIKLLDSSKDSSAEVFVGNAKYTIDVASTPSKQLADNICADFEASGSDVENNLEHVMAPIQNWLSALSPDCNFNFQLDGKWYCAVETTSVQEAANELDSIRRNMIRRWNRQPYILTRRLAVARNLATVLKSRHSQENMVEFCDILQSSSPAELPVALRSSKWRFAVCKNSSTNRVEAAHVGLTKALGEIEYLRRLFESSSKMGYLSLNVPKDKAPSKDLWVSLEPLEDVAENIVSFSDSFEKPNQNIAVPQSTSGDGCWHPLFSDENSELLIAKKLELTGTTPLGSHCRSSEAADKSEKKRVFKYFADSITSETEFVITNGNGKLLRLPPGTYRYTLRQHHTDLLEMNSPESLPSAHGTISWQRKRPRATIKRW